MKGCNQVTCRGVPVKAGCAGLDALRARTRIDPWFAVVSGVAHGGEVEYSRAQAIAEFFAERDPRDLTDAREVERMLAPLLPPPKPVEVPAKRAEQLKLFGLGQALDVQMGVGKMSKRFAAAARGYLRAMQDKRGRLTRKDIDRITWAVCDECRPDAKERRKKIDFDLGPAEKTGIGRKAGALMREYLGDDRAVAVDRHIAGYVFAVTGKLGEVRMARISKEDREVLQRRPEVIQAPPARKGGSVRLFYRAADGTVKPLDVRPWQRGDQISKAEFAFGESVIRELAADCGVSAAAFQVAVWLQSACAAKGRGINYSLPLTGGSTFRCAPILGQPALPGLHGALGRVAELERRMRRSSLRLYRVGNVVMTG